MSDQTNVGTQSAPAQAPAQAPAAPAAPTASSVLSGILAVVEHDSEGALLPLLTDFKNGVDASPSIEGATAAGLKFAADSQLALPAVAGTLIKDLTNLLVGDAIGSLTSATNTTGQSGS